MLLRQVNQERRHLAMPCCGSSVAMKTSSRGTFFFAHMGERDCATAPESEQHLQLKHAAVMAARRSGWTAETEVAGLTPSGVAWRADVLAERASHRVAVEIQWSSQTNDETLERQAIYRLAGVRGLWLLRQPGFPVSRDLPAVCIGGDLDTGLKAFVPTWEHMRKRDRDRVYGWHQVLSAEAFFEAVFEERFQFGLKGNSSARVELQVGSCHCWSCGAETNILAGVGVKVSEDAETVADLVVADFDSQESIILGLVNQLPPHLAPGPIERRFSKTTGETHLSNVCAHCDALQGAFYAHEAEELGSHQVAIVLDAAWCELIERRPGYAPHWHVYPRAPQQSDEIADRT